MNSAFTRVRHCCLSILVLVSPGAVAAQPPVRLDAYGDPLPPGAVARLGTTRLRQSEAVHGLVFTADGKGLLSVGSSTVRLRDVATGRLVRSWGAFTEVAWGLFFATDGKQFVAVGKDGRLRLWDIAGGQ